MIRVALLVTMAAGCQPLRLPGPDSGMGGQAGMAAVSDAGAGGRMAGAGGAGEGGSAAGGAAGLGMGGQAGERPTVFEGDGGRFALTEFTLPPRARLVTGLGGDAFGYVYASTTGDTANVFVLAPDSGSFVEIDGGAFLPVGLLVTRAGWVHVVESRQIQSCFRSCSTLSDFVPREPPLGAFERLVGGCLDGEALWLLTSSGDSSALLRSEFDGGWSRSSLAPFSSPRSCAVGPGGDAIAVVDNTLVRIRQGALPEPVAVAGVLGTPDWKRVAWVFARGLSRPAVVGALGRVAEPQTDGGWALVGSSAVSSLNWQAAAGSSAEELVVVGSEPRGSPNILIRDIDGGQQSLSVQFAHLESVWMQNDNTFFVGGQQLHRVGGVVGASLSVGRR